MKRWIGLQSNVVVEAEPLMNANSISLTTFHGYNCRPLGRSEFSPV